ncbi:hypothetical protein M0R04_07975 [Candidatus Dojkabacteria bacterium]|nr:hypothetical protein [Candidatus Dojkabacteria bacterium]
MQTINEALLEMRVDVYRFKFNKGLISFTAPGQVTLNSTQDIYDIQGRYTKNTNIPSNLIEHRDTSADRYDDATKYVKLKMFPI